MENGFSVLLLYMMRVEKTKTPIHLNISRTARTHALLYFRIFSVMHSRCVSILCPNLEILFVKKLII